jgi:NAD+ kinase
MSHCPTLTLTDLLLFQVSDETVNVDVMASHQSENGSISTASSTVSLLESEKAAYEFLAQTPVRSTDAHLIEFSEALRSKDRHTFYFE